ncbi:MAG: PAS domain S-box protein [Acidobacteriota bacterium]
MKGIRSYFRGSRLPASLAGLAAGVLLLGACALLWIGYLAPRVERHHSAGALAPGEAQGEGARIEKTAFLAIGWLLSLTGGLATYLLVNRQRRLEAHVEEAVRDARNLNERLEAQLAARRETEARFTAFMSHLPGMAFIRDARGLYVWTSGGWCRETGLPAEEVPGLSPSAVFPDVVARDFLDLDRRVLEEQRSLRQEFALPGPDGYKFWTETVFPIPVPGGSEPLVGGIALDITGLKRAQAELRESERRHRELFEGSLAGVFSTTVEGEILACNDACARLFGLPSAEEAKKHSAWEGYFDLDARRAFLDALRASGSVNGHEMAVRRLDGATLWILVTAKLEKDERGRLVVSGTLVDITERRLAEKALRESEACFQAFLARVPGVVFIRDAEGRYVYVNEAWEALSGLPSQEVLGKTPADLFPHETALRILEEDARTLAGRVQVWEEEPEEVGGRTRYFSCSKFPLPCGEGRPPRVAGISVDITDRKSAQESLRAFVDHIPGPAFLRDAEGRYVYVNEAWEGLMKLERKDVLGKTPGDLFPPELAEPIEAEDRSAREGRHLEWQEEAQEFDGQIRFFSCSKFPLGAVPGEIPFVGGISVDVTDRRRALDALRESERYFRDLFECAHDPILIFDPESEAILDANQRAVEVYGFPREELLGLSLETLTLDLLRGKDAIRRTLAAGANLEFETAHRRKDGRLLSIEANAAVITFRGRPAILTINRDVTRRREAEQALAESERRYRLLFERNLAGVYRARMDGSLIECNQAFARLFGFTSPEEVMQASSHRFTARSEDYEAFRARLLRDGAVTDHEVQTRRKDGSLFRILENAVLVREPGQEPYLEGTLIDVTGQRRRAQVEARARQLEALGKIAQGLAHEVRNPLFAIQVNLSALRRLIPASPEGETHVDLMNENVQRLDRLMRTMMELSLSVAPEEIEAVSLGPLVEQAVQEARSQEPGRAERVEIRVSLPQTAPTLWAAPKKVALALSHLIANALTASPEGATVIVKGQVDGGQVRVLVEDAGHGIPVAKADRLFEPFFTTRQGRSGLGLTLARHYAQIHGGSLIARNNADRGATFVLQFPLDCRPSPPPEG